LYGPLQLGVQAGLIISSIIDLFSQLATKGASMRLTPIDGNGWLRRNAGSATESGKSYNQEQALKTTVGLREFRKKVESDGHASDGIEAESGAGLNLRFIGFLDVLILKLFGMTEHSIIAQQQRDNP
jgi:hypothetical protein